MRGVSYWFYLGKIIGVLGRNGVGKIILFNIFYGDFVVDNGIICLLKDNYEYFFIDKDIGIVYFENYFLEFLIGYEFVKFYMDLYFLDDLMIIDDYLDFMEIG